MLGLGFRVLGFLASDTLSQHPGKQGDEQMRNMDFATDLRRITLSMHDYFVGAHAVKQRLIGHRPL